MRRALAALLLCACATAQADPYLWLEDNAAARTQAWVHAQNTHSVESLAQSTEFARLNTRLAQILNSEQRIPHVVKQGDRFYNFWRDASSPRGIWRRTTFESFRSGTPEWETVLDVDALARDENENWIWRGAECTQLHASRCLLHLSRGGGDAVVVREFDLDAKRFPEDGFVIPEAKSRVAWRDRDRLYVGADFGPGSLTQAGYPRLVKLWTRGTPLSEAITVFEGQNSDVSVAAFATEEPGYRREFITRAIGGNSGQTFIRQDSGWARIELPDGIEATPFRNYLIVLLRHPWRTNGRVYPSGSLLAIDLDRFMEGDRAFRYLFKPSARSTLLNYTTTQNRLLLNVLDNSRSRLYAVTLGDYRVRRTTVPTLAHEAIMVSAVDEFATDDYFLTATGFLEPTALYLGKNRERELLYRLPEQFDARGLQVTRHRAVSKDGTLIPYFMIARKDLARDGSHPTLLTGYGGFEVARTPQYDAIVGAAWLERGGVYVVANIRGGGEFGPAWHQAALRGRRQTAYDDFIGVAEDLVARKITSPRHLGIIGNSNGGLLVAAVALQRPELFGAVVSSAPLLDMRRYSKLSAGASWLAEFGDPDRPEDWAYLRAYSPYHNVLPDKRYPPMLFITSLRDDRVHPAHARKMTARMRSLGHDAWFYESAEGGHASADAAQQAYAHAMAYAFLLDRLK